MENKKTVVVIAELKIKEDFCEEFIDFAKNIVEATRKEKGCIRYELIRDVLDAQTFFFLEEYVDDDAFQAHRKMPYMDEFRAFRNKVVAEFKGVSTLERLAIR